jgi:hypothetical protein
MVTMSMPLARNDFFGRNLWSGFLVTRYGFCGALLQGLYTQHRITKLPFQLLIRQTPLHKSEL